MRFPLLLPKYYLESLIQAIHQGPIQFTTLVILQIPPALAAHTHMAKIIHQDSIVIFFSFQVMNFSELRISTIHMFVNSVEEPQHILVC